MQRHILDPGSRSPEEALARMSTSVSARECPIPINCHTSNRTPLPPEEVAPSQVGKLVAIALAVFALTLLLLLIPLGPPLQLLPPLLVHDACNNHGLTRARVNLRPVEAGRVSLSPASPEVRKIRAAPDLQQPLVNRVHAGMVTLLYFVYTPLLADVNDVRRD